MSQVVIVGGGVVGAMVAYELSRLGQTVTLCESDVPGAGSTGAALGVLMGIISQKTTGRGWRLREQSIRRYQTLLPELTTLTGQGIPHNSHGIVMLRFADDPHDHRWQRLQKVREKQGWPLELWDREELRSHCPQLESDRLLGAVYSPQDGQLDPLALTAALWAGAQHYGADCRSSTPVEGLGCDQQRCTEVVANGKTLACDWLILAAGLGSTPLTAQLQQPVAIQPVLGQAFRVKLPQPLDFQDFAPVISGEDVHLVPLGGGEYWIGATVEFPDDQGVVVADPGLKEQVWQQAIALCPALAPGKIVETWSGLRPRPQGQPAPLIGPLPGYRNVLLATGHYRNGVLLAPATAEAISEAICGIMT